MLLALVIALVCEATLMAETKDVKALKPDIKPDLQKVYNEAMAWSQTKIEEMPTVEQSQSTSGIGVCKGGNTHASKAGEPKADVLKVLPLEDLPLAPGCKRKKQGEENVAAVAESDSLPSDVNGEPSSNKISENKILVFVSFSMPKASLEALSHQAEQHNAVLVMRGLKDDSFKASQHAFKDLGRETKSGIEINPEAFETYHIKQVPVFVLVKATDANNTEELARLSGNVSLDFAANKLKEFGNPA